MKVPRIVMMLVAVALAGACGCTKKMVVYQYPGFWEPDLGVNSLAVWPFRNQTQSQGAGDIAADKLAAALTANGTYTVYNVSDLGAVEGARDLQLLAGDVEAATSAGRKFGRADAVITGTVTSFDGASKVETRYNAIPIYRTDGRGNLFIAGYNNVPYQFTRHDATAECTASLVRLRDGKVVYSAHGVGTDWAQGPTPPRDLNGCMMMACTTMVLNLVEQLAIVRKEVKIGADTLRTAAGLYDNRWDLAKSFPADAERMMVVLRLPPPCDRNRFRLVIIRKNQREELASQELEWDDAFPPIGQPYAFSPAQIAAKGGGPGVYTVKFYSGPEPILTIDFTIRPPARR